MCPKNLLSSFPNLCCESFVGQSLDNFFFDEKYQLFSDISQGTAQVAPPDLSQIIDGVYKHNPTWKCVLEKPEQPPVAVALHWVGREKELQQLEEWSLNNISYHIQQEPTKQMYRSPLVHGGLGVGKSRLVVHSNWAIKHKLQTTNPTFKLPSTGLEPPKDIAFNDAFGHVGHIFIDFSRADKYGDRDKVLDISTSLGLRIAAHFFFGVGFDALTDKIIDMEQRKQFTFGNVFSLVNDM